MGSTWGTVKVSRVRGPIVFGWSLLLQPKLSHKKINNIYQTHNIYLPYPPKKILQRGYLLSCHIRLIFEEEFLIPQEDSIDSLHHSEESPVNSTTNPPIKNNLNLSPIAESVWIIENIPIDPIILDYN